MLDGDVRNVAGATMTSRATVDAARRALALHTVLFPPVAAEGEDGDDGSSASDGSTAVHWPRTP